MLSLRAFYPMLFITCSISCARPSSLFIAPQCRLDTVKHQSVRSKTPIVIRPTHSLRTSSPTAKYQPPTTMPPSIPATSQTPITGPSWDLSDEYPSLDSPKLASDINTALESITTIQNLSKPIIANLPSARTLTLAQATDLDILSSLQKINTHNWSAYILLDNVATYVNCISSVDGNDEAAKKKSVYIGELFAKLEQAGKASELFLRECKEEVVEKYLKMEDVGANEFLVRMSRKMKEYSLSLKEEDLVTGLEVSGVDAWGRLYTDISAQIVVKIEEEDGKIVEMGIAKAAGLLDGVDEGMRRKAWYGINKAWGVHSETCAAVLNAITAWRLEMYGRRGMKDFMFMPLYRNRMERKTLNALFEAIDDNLDVGRRALKVQAAALGKKKLDPWDAFAPAPVGDPEKATKYTFDEGIEVVAEAVGAIDAKAGEFVRMMKEKRWIEATRGDSKVPGAYCTGFEKSRNPRVYLSEYNGRANLLLTLAHELGHAYHSWVMRDLPHPQTEYPMNLAETASTFFETVVSNDLIKRAKTTEEKFAIAWGNAQSAATFLLNIPTRYKFEYDLNKRRADGKLSAKELDTMMVDSWKHYYGDSLGRLDEVGPFSMSKLHFYISGLSFYNFVYSMGFILSNGIYAERDRVGAESFTTMYVNLLRDTGRMTAEEVVEKHIGGKIYEPEFWKGGIGILRKQVEEFEQLAGELGYKVTE